MLLGPVKATQHDAGRPLFDLGRHVGSAALHDLRRHPSDDPHLGLLSTMARAGTSDRPGPVCSLGVGPSSDGGPTAGCPTSPKYPPGRMVFADTRPRRVAMSRRGGPRLSALDSHTLGSPKALHLVLFNGFELRSRGRIVGLPLSAGRVVAFLALQRTSQSRSFVAGTLWPGTTDSRAGANLRSALWRLRRMNRPIVEATVTRLHLCQGVDVDVLELEAAIRRITDGGSHVPAQDIERILSPADLLPGWYEDWVVFERERFRQLRLHALDALSERLVARGRFALAVEAALAAVREEPLRESSHRSLIRAHLAEGNVSEAIREYRGYRRLLNEELGVPPSREMEGLLHPQA